jgi:pyridoxal phosphate enzyme (YggS family)
VEALTALQLIREKIAKAATLAGVSAPELVAVSKTKSVDQMLELYAQGQRVFGENYVQELSEKSAELQILKITDLELHFIGHLQTNKVKAIVPLVSTIHSVDSLRLYSEIEKRAKDLSKKICVYFQVNIDRESSKGGFLPEALADLCLAISAQAFSSVRTVGLMAIPNPELDPSRAFAEMKSLSDQFGSTLGRGLSMGMSSDFEAAIAFSATSIRIGTALFGTRE